MDQYGSQNVLCSYQYIQGHERRPAQRGICIAAFGFVKSQIVVDNRDTFTPQCKSKVQGLPVAVVWIKIGILVQIRKKYTIMNVLSG